ncbi:MAG: hypothetical protein CFE46_00800 [Burkholderiales bacterium PBB6]|nr:MAG: hypothetical protein CFE46_00800 [Burkholderiales bacterium PBB6]
MATVRNYEGELASKLAEYRTLGQREAKASRPTSDAAAPDQHEVALSTAAEGWLAAEQQLFDRHVTEASREVVEATQKVIELQANAEQLMSDDSASSMVDAELAGVRPVLVRATEERLGAELSLKYFRASNDITEEARYPESIPWHLGVLAILVVVETTVNAFFYENSQGLLGGVVVALGIAALNMFVALGCGLFFRYKNLKAPDKKVVGWSSLVLFVFVSLFCNALFAAFRTEYQLVVDPSEFSEVSVAFRHAWPEAVLLFKGDMEFKDHWSFLLFGIGLLLSVWAFYKGYTLDDRFPGHGSKDKAFRAAAQLETEEQDKARHKVKELLHHRRAQVQAALHEPSTQVGMLARRIADLQHARKSMEQRAAAVLRDFSLVIGAYRQANASVSVLPRPAYFKNPPALAFAVDGSAADEVVVQLSGVQGLLKQLADDQREGLNARLNALQSDSAHLLNQSLSGFFADVRQEAQESITRRTPTIHRTSDSN